MQIYGGFWVRVLAYIIDYMILQVASSVFLVAMMFVVLGSGGVNDTAAGVGVFAIYGLTFVLNWLYFAILESSKYQGTVGKQALKLVVTDEQGERIGFGRATGRYFAKFLSIMIMLFGFFMVGWTQRKQGLHDFVAGTLVHKADSPDLARNSASVFE
jgi:uncharacterized RDD family membrane protein YckC